MTIPTFSTADDGSTHEIKNSKTFAIELDEMAGGYTWVLYCTGDVNILHADYLALTAAAGSAGRQRWVLEAAVPGRYVVEAKLWREWLGDSSSISRYRITVILR